MDFIAAMEDALGRKAIRDYQPMQTGDVPMTWADTTLLRNLTGFVPQTDMRQGVGSCVERYLSMRRQDDFSFFLVFFCRSSIYYLVFFLIGRVTTEHYTSLFVGVVRVV